jgi:hypothetical protein
MWTDGQTGTMNLIVVFRHLAEASNNLDYIYNDFTEVTLYYCDWLISYFHHIRSYFGKIECNEMGRACGAYGGGEWCAQVSGGET